MVAACRAQRTLQSQKVLIFFVGLLPTKKIKSSSGKPYLFCWQKSNKKDNYFDVKKEPLCSRK